MKAAETRDERATALRHLHVATSLVLTPQCSSNLIYNALPHCMQEVAEEYEQRNIPLDVLVTDMDWHITFYKEAAEGKKDQV